MKARARFYARGQSDEARGVPFVPNRPLMNSWPLWAKQAYCAGRLDAQQWKAKFREAVLSICDTSH